MANSVSNIFDLTYSKHALAFSEHICRNFSYYKQYYEELIDEEIYKFTSKVINTKINLYRPADTTAESAIKLAEQNNREIGQIGIMVRSVIKVYNDLLTQEEKKWFIDNLLNLPVMKTKSTLEDKRTRKYILSHICYCQGMPEDRPRNFKNSLIAQKGKRELLVVDSDKSSQEQLFRIK